MRATFLFDDEELAALHHSVQERASSRVSPNDALLAHFLALVAEADPGQSARHLLFALDWRGKCALSNALIGNFSSCVDVEFEPGKPVEERAASIRRAIDRWTPNYHATHRFLAANGGISKIYRMTPSGFDLGASLTLSNWNKFGVYDTTFGVDRPVFVSPWVRATIPWHGFILEGPENKGLQLCVSICSARQPVREIRGRPRCWLGSTATGRRTERIASINACRGYSSRTIVTSRSHGSSD